VESGDDLRLFKEWDSLAALRVLVAIEREFAVTLPHDLLVNEPRLDRVTAVLRAAMLHREVR
jgi:acyl carrier protein